MSKKTKWSAEQEKIFGWFERGRGNLVVRARAGTGKTTTILEGVERAPEQKILMAAFNKSIADELTKRIRNERVSAKTLHGLGYSYVRRAWGAVQVDSEGRRARSLAEAACEADAPLQAVALVAKVCTKVREVLPLCDDADDALEVMTSFDLLPDESLELEHGVTPRWVATRALRAVELAKKRVDKIDFADMIFLPVACKMVQPWFDLVVVDEAQDMTEAQLALAVGACRRGGRIAVVGDDRQAIYGFRGADSECLDRLKSALKAKELGLTTTYRCPRRVVEIAARFVPDYRAAPSAPEGVVEHCDAESLVLRAGPRDFVLSRTNGPLVRTCLTLLKAGKKASVKGRDVGRGIQALVDKMRASGIADLRAKVAEWLDRETQRAVSNLPEEAAEERVAQLADQADVVRALADDCATVEDLKAKLATLFTDVDGQAVVCSTTHRAKGLEADCVFMLEETFRPRADGRGEESNIYYVAVTRSRNRLVFVRDAA